MGWDLTVLEREHDLDEPGDPGRGLQVPDVRLHRAKDQGPVGRAALAEHGSQRPHLDGIAQGRPGAVGLDVTHFGRRHRRHREGLPDEGLLGRAVGHGQTPAAAVLVHGRAANHRQDRVALGEGVGQALQHDDPATLAPHVPVCRRVERLAQAVRGQHPGPAKADGDLGPQHQVDSSRQGGTALPIAQALTGQVHGDER